MVNLSSQVPVNWVQTMKFAVDTVSKVSGRLGRLYQTESGKSFQTPLLVQSTKAGSIPYLSKETFGYVTNETQILQICFSNCHHMEKALEVHQKGIASFIGYDGDTPTFLTLKDPCEIAPSGYHEKDIVPLFTRRGKATITADRYMDFVEKIKPDIYHALCDSDTNDESPKKRIMKSVERTEQFFKACIERHKNSEVLRKSLFFAPIVGGYSKEARSKCIKSILHEPNVCGYLIDGLHNNGESALRIQIDNVKDIVSHCLKELCEENPRMMLGPYTPLDILELVQLGVDIFDTSYVYILVTKSRALTLNLDIHNQERNIPVYIDLSSEKYRESFEPLFQNCLCLACRKHTRAYVHHLIKTKELLAPILLMIHNTHQYLKFFETIRRLIVEDNLQELIASLKTQTQHTVQDSTKSEKIEIHANDDNSKNKNKVEVL